MSLRPSILLSVLFIHLSCKSDKQSQIEVPDTKKVENISVDELPKKHNSLTKAQLNDFFPDYLGSHKRYNIFVIASETSAIASYGNFDNSYNYSLKDGIKNKSVVKNFELSYSSDLTGPEGTEYVKKVRDGYETIAFLQPDINRYSIDFIYNNRFRLVIEGPEKPDVLWTYFKMVDLKKLDNY